MNYLVFLPEQIKNNQVALKGDVARELIKEHELVEGINISALVYGEGRGKALVKEASGDSVLVELRCNQPALIKNQLELVVGLCRPQSVKKVIAASFALGAKKIHFVKAENSQKSYQQSKIWSDEHLKKEFILGMAQTGDSIPPVICQYKSLNHFLSSDVEMKEMKRVVYDSSGAVEKAESEGYKICAFGPEAGWTSSELDMFNTNEFKVISLGERILRIEQAVMSIL